MYQFCTIGSGNYLPFIQTLFRSLKAQHQDVELHALLTEGSLPEKGEEGLYFYALDQLAGTPFLTAVIDRYSYRNDYLRWALKPLFLRFLTQRFKAVIYVDNDIHFFSSFAFLFKELEQHTLLLTPHWCASRPVPHEENFRTNYQIGLYNAGFIGATASAGEVLDWWTAACLHEMKRDDAAGLFDDQRYLDLAPVVDPAVGIVRHRGCNLGSWNMHENTRSLVDGEVRICNKYGVVFIHFNHDTIWHIVNGNDTLLRPYFEQYASRFRKTGQNLEQYVTGLKEWRNSGLLLKLKRRTLLRTRLKRWLFRLSERL
jgi:hypothetical protein